MVEDALTDKVKGNRALSKEVKEVLQNKQKADLVAGRVSAGPGYVLASDFCEFELAYLKHRTKVTQPHIAVLRGECMPNIPHYLGAYKARCAL